jgi:hypothetical protein
MLHLHLNRVAMASLHCFMFVSVTHVLVWFAFTEETHSLVLHLHINRVAVDFPSLFSVCVCHPWSCLFCFFTEERHIWCLGALPGFGAY